MQALFILIISLLNDVWGMQKKCWSSGSYIAKSKMLSLILFNTIIFLSDQPLVTYECLKETK